MYVDKKDEAISLVILEQVYFLEFEAMQNYLVISLVGSTLVGYNLLYEVVVYYSFFVSPVPGLDYRRVGPQ